MRITVLALGTRGDVQPYIALGLGLQRAGHEVTLLATDDFADFVTGYGLLFSPMGFSLREELRESAAVQAVLVGGRDSLRGLWQMIQETEALLDLMAASTWRACQTAEATIFSTFGLTAYHAAEKLGLPCFWAMTMPLTPRTRALPNPIFPPLSLGSGYNLFSHRFTELFVRQLLGRFFNRWRREHLNLPPIPLHVWPYSRLRGQPVPCFVHCSPAVIPKPPDWGAHVHVTGYWFLPHAEGWEPPADLVAFLEAGPPPVYVGFGSMTIQGAESTTRIVLEALRLAGQRGVLAMGWGDVASRHDARSDVFFLESCPHDWLFPRMAAAVHHGGAGTTGAGLRAGIPTILVPFAGDQLFWGARVKALGVVPEPIPRGQLTAEKLAYAIRVAVEHEPMRQRAAILGERIRAEDGVARAVEIIEGLL